MRVANRHMTYWILAVILVLALTPGCGKDDNPVAPNNPPVITNIEVKLGTHVLTEAEYSSLPAGQTLILTCSAEDADNDILTTSWSASHGTLDSIDTRCVNWTLPDASVSAELTVVVSDGEDTDSETVLFTIIQAPSLIAGRVWPSNGHGGGTFTYEVTYTDPSNQDPKTAEVIVNGTAQTMSKISGAPESGSSYLFETTHEIGSHDYYFRFVDDLDSVITFPDGAYAVGPLVTSLPILVDEDVIVIDEQEGVSLESVVGSSYTFTFSGLPPFIGAGDVIIGTEPSGYLRRVISATIIEDEIQVFTTSAVLNEALINGRTDTTFVIEIGADGLAGDDGPLPDGVYIEDGRLRLENTQIFSGEAGSATATVLITEGEIAWEPQITHDINMQYGSLARYTAAAEGEMAFSFDASLQTNGAALLVFGETLELAHLTYSRVQMLDWFPVCTDYMLTFTAGLRFNAGTAGTTTYGLNGVGDVDLGAGYELGAEWWTVEVALPTSARHECSWDAFATTSVTVSVNTAVVVKLYGRELSNLAANPYVKFDGEVTLDPSCHWNMSVGLPCPVEAFGAVLDPDLENIYQQREVLRTYALEDCYEVSLTTDDESIGGGLNDEGYSVITTVDGGYVITGYTASAGAGGLDVYLAKVNEYGTLDWEQTFGSVPDDAGHCVIATEDGGYAIAGYTFSYGEGEGDVYLIKTDANGDLEWQNTFGGALDERGWCLVQTSDGGYAIAGRARSWSGGVCDIYLVKTDEYGQLEWQQTYGEAGSDRAYSMVLTPDGGYALCGYTKSFGVSGQAAYLIKFDSDGDFVWDEVFDLTVGDDCAYSLTLADDGGLVMAGSTPGDPFLIKTDADGTLLWQNLDLGGPSLDGAKAVALMPDNGFLMGGYFYTSPEGLSDAYVVKTDALGALEWRYRLGGTGADIFESVKPTATGFIAVGSTTPYGGDADIYVVKAVEN